MMPTEPPLHVWLYRGWCWVCRRCKSAGYGHPSRDSALAEALTHCRRSFAEWMSGAA